MFRTVVRAYALFSLLFLFALLIFFVARLSSVRDENALVARNSFTELEVRAAETIDLGPSETRSLMRPSLEGPEGERLEAVILYTIDEGVSYLWARSPAYTDRGFTGGSGVPRMEYNELTQLKFTATVGEDSSFLLEALYTVLDRRDIYPLLRTSLIAVLAVALSATILAIIAVRRHREPERGVASEGRGAPVGVEAAGNVVAGEDEGRGEWSVETPGEAESPRSEPGPSGKPKPLGETGDALFAPSGLSRQEHLMKRLSLELERAAQNEQDLTLLVLEYQEQKPYDEAYLRHAGELLDHFGFEDLAFEEHDRFVVIFPNTTLREGLRRVERFQKELLETGPTSDVDHPWAGLSSRNGRLIDAGRLYSEASIAVRKSHDTPGRILGFEPDPDKYRAAL